MHISVKEIWRNLDGPPKNKEMWSYVAKFEFSRPKTSSAVMDKYLLFILTDWWLTFRMRKRSVWSRSRSLV